MKWVLETLRWIAFPVTTTLVVVGSVCIILAGILVPIRLGGLSFTWRGKATERKVDEQ